MTNRDQGKFEKTIFRVEVFRISGNSVDDEEKKRTTTSHRYLGIVGLNLFTKISCANPLFQTCIE